ncbi:hypothetical protein M422DRAFT_777721 [Sphaerobolus stellatus SS14]|nr:hypothetical protein M422DRAFT_777721 [Sphaerobolus stellatus SS14]
MVSFSRLSSRASLNAGLLLLWATSAFALRVPLTPRMHATHRIRDVAPGLQLTTFHPENTFETFGEGIDLPLSKRDNPGPTEEAAAAFVKSRLGITDSDLATKSGFDGEVSKHAFFSQVFKGIPVANAVANVALNLQNKVVSFGNNFVKPKSIPSTTPSISVQSAISIAEKNLLATHNDHPPSIEFFAKEDGTLALTHVIQVQNNDHWFEAFVDAHSGQIVNIIDFVAHASYNVLPLNQQSLLDGPFQILTDPADPLSSPFGWHSDGTPAFNPTTTAGNNAIAFKTNQSTLTTESSDGDNFIFVFNPAVAPTVSPNIDVARTNAFYVVNSIHDITYRYGFTEAAFNFQNNNFGKGGKGNDRVTISVQDASGIDNANFATPPDGQSGSMRMFLWDFTSPERDGAIENDIVSHENTHGLSNRMTGGGTGRCLSTTEAGGMGEGWSDAFAEWTEHKDASVPDFTLGVYVENSTAGIRTHPYSTSPTVNPLTYANLQTLSEVHAIGEVWANMLHNVYAGLVGVHGFSPNATTDPTTTGGNTVFLHLFIDALALQPCNPTFLTARNAWFQADVNRFGGANNCTLWQQFASRGLGVNAANHINNFDVPVGC